MAADCLGEGSLLQASVSPLLHRRRMGILPNVPEPMGILRSYSIPATLGSVEAVTVADLTGSDGEVPVLELT